MTRPRRFYFISGDWDDSYIPTNKVCYWEPGRGVVDVSTNVEFDLGTGWLARKADGGLLSTGARWYRVIDPVEYGDWWDSSDQVQLTEDTIVYALDKDVTAATPLVDGELVLDTWNDVGWWGLEVVPPQSMWDGGHFVIELDDGGFLVIGQRHRLYVDTDDAAEGEIFHRYTADGTLISRHHPLRGYYQWPGYPNGYTYGWEILPQWVAYDRERQIVYVQDAGWALTRYHLATDVVEGAPSVFPWQQTIMGSDPTAGGTYSGEYLLSRGIIAIDRGESVGGSRYGSITAYELWRSRRVEQIAVDSTTGYVWALLHAYEAYYGESATNVTPLSGVGGWGGTDDEMQLLCIDPEQLFWITAMGPPPNFYSPMPYDHYEGTEHRSSIANRFVRPFTAADGSGPGLAPPQRQADVKTIILTHGPVMVTLPEGDPDRDYFTTPYIKYFNVQETLNSVLTTESIPINYTDDFEVVGFEVYVGGSGAGVVELSLGGIGGPLALGSLDLATDRSLVCLRAQVPAIDALLRAGPGTLTVTATSGSPYADTVYVTAVTKATMADVEPGDPFEIPGAYAWYFNGSFSIPPEGGIAYYALHRVVYDENAFGTTLMETVYEIDLETGVSTEVFRDDRRSTDPDYLPGGPYADEGPPHLRHSILQILPGDFIQPITGGALESRRRFT